MIINRKVYKDAILFPLKMDDSGFKGSELEQAIKAAFGGRPETETILHDLERLREESRLNPVTGQPGFKQLQADIPRFESKYKARRRSADPINEKIYVLMADIDHFGRFNKLYGEDVGNQVLEGVANIIPNTFRDDDVVIRLNFNSKPSTYHLHGEEFLGFYHCQSIEEAVKVAERVRHKVETRSPDLTGHQVTVSIGLTEWHPEAESFKAAQKRADGYMQMAKKEGRNRIYVDGQDPQWLFDLKREIYFHDSLQDFLQKVPDTYAQAKGYLGRTATSGVKALTNFLKR